MEGMRPFVLVIMDGWGVTSPWGGNATSIARTPNISYFWQKAPRAILGAAGESVGLPHGERGNSEVGHLNIGSGQVVHQDLKSISATIEDGSFFNNPVLKGAMQAVKQRNSQLHLLGLVSDGGIHSHINHLFAVMDMAKQEGVTNVVIHIITDGRDTMPMEALRFVEAVENKIKDVPGAVIGSIMGRFFAMDRDHRWDRVERAYRVLTEGMGQEGVSPRAAVSDSYRQGQSDEFIVPCAVRLSDQTKRFIKDDDVIIFNNFRGDRAREITQALVQPDFKGFHRSVRRKNIKFITFTSYQEGMPVEVAFPPKEVITPLAKVLADAGWKQLHIAETEKYPHVTYFFNGGKEEAFPKEDRIMIPSPKVRTYDQKPEMSAQAVTKELLKKMGGYDFIVVNFANPDMVGHTGVMRAAVKAVETVDKYVGFIWQEVKKRKGCMAVTADHGNVEQMVNPATGMPDTEHTTNPVPFFFLEPTGQVQINRTGILADIAPTILDFYGLPIPGEMTGKSLVVKSETRMSNDETNPKSEFLKFRH